MQLTPTIRINGRLVRYNDRSTIVEQLSENGGLSPYQNYKTGTVSQFLYRALEKVRSGTYGICDVCGNPIPQRRLELVPAALTCVPCDPRKT